MRILPMVYLDTHMHLARQLQPPLEGFARLPPAFASKSGGSQVLTCAAYMGFCLRFKFGVERGRGLAHGSS